MQKFICCHGKIVSSIILAAAAICCAAGLVRMARKGGHYGKVTE